MRKLFLLLIFPALLSAQSVFDTLSFARPLNATAYANGDIVCALADSAILRFSKFKDFSYGWITKASIAVDTPSTAGSFRLWLFRDSTGFAKIGDNAAWVAPAAMIQRLLIGFIDFNFTSLGLGAGSGGASDVVILQPIPYRGVGKNGIYAILTTTSSYTPENGGRITLSLTGFFQ